MRTPSLFLRVLASSVLACWLLPSCAPEDEDLEDLGQSEFAVQGADGTPSVQVCHVAGKEPHEILVGFDAVRAHLAHGDFLGPCAPPISSLGR